MSLEFLQQRKLDLQKAMSDTHASIHIIQGHIQEVDYIISEVERLAEVKPEVCESEAVLEEEVIVE